MDSEVLIDLGLFLAGVVSGFVLLACWQPRWYRRHIRPYYRADDGAGSLEEYQDFRGRK